MIQQATKVTTHFELDSGDYVIIQRFKDGKENVYRVLGNPREVGAINALGKTLLSEIHQRPSTLILGQYESPLRTRVIKEVTIRAFESK